MKKTRNPLRINVGFLLSQPKGTSRDFQIDLAGIKLSEDLDTQKINGKVRISRTSEGLLVQGEFLSLVHAACSRCIDNFTQTLMTDFTELYTFPKQYAYEQSDDEDPELVLPIDGYIDLSTLLREYLLLEIPINPLCHTDCKGLCPQCGTNLNQDNCGHSMSPAAFFPVQSGHSPYTIM